MKKWTEYMATEVMESKQQVMLIKLAINAIYLKIKDMGRVLCIGAGDGTEMEYIPYAEGIDLNEESLKKCKEKGLKVHKMDMHKMTFPDNSFDLIFCKDTFEHAVAPIKVLEEFARVSKKYVVIILPNEEWQSDSYHLIIPTLLQMLSLAEKCKLLLLSYREYNLMVNQTSIRQSLYIFQK